MSNTTNKFQLELTLVFDAVIKAITENPIIDNKSSLNSIEGVVKGQRLKLVRSVNTENYIPYYQYTVRDENDYSVYGLPTNLFDDEQNKYFYTTFNKAVTKIDKVRNEKRNDNYNTFTKNIVNVVIESL